MSELAEVTWHDTNCQSGTVVALTAWRSPDCGELCRTYKIKDDFYSRIEVRIMRSINMLARNCPLQGAWGKHPEKAQRWLRAYGSLFNIQQDILKHSPTGRMIKDDPDIWSI